MLVKINRAYLAQDGDKIMFPKECTLSDSVNYAATIAGKLVKGVTLYDQYGKQVTMERLMSMVNHMYSTSHNVLTDSFIIKLVNVSDKSMRYTSINGQALQTNMGAIHSQLINIKLFYEKINYKYDIEVFDEFRSAGAVDVQELEASYFVSKLCGPLTIITDNRELFYSYCDNGTLKTSIVDCYKNIFKFVYVEDMKQLANRSNILHELGATINTCKRQRKQYKHTHNEYRIHLLSSLFGYEVTGEETEAELDSVVRYFCEHLEECVDITKGYNYLNNLVLPSKLQCRLNNYLNELVLNGTLSTNDDLVYYEDSNSEEESEMALLF